MTKRGSGVYVNYKNIIFNEHNMTPLFYFETFEGKLKVLLFKDQISTNYAILHISFLRLMVHILKENDSQRHSALIFGQRAIQASSQHRHKHLFH